MAVTYDFQTPGVSTSAADTQEDIRNIAEMSWVWHVNASPHTLTNKPTGLIEAFYDSTVDFTSGIPSYGYQNYYFLKAYDGTNLGNVNFIKLYVHNDGAVLSNTIGARGEEYISMGVNAGYSCQSLAPWTINADVGNSGTSTYDPILAFQNQSVERARIYTDTSDSHKLKFDVGGSDQMVIDSSGNVGIGTSSPSSPLHVKATNNIIMSLQSSDATTGNLYFNFRNDNGDEKGWIGYGSSTTDDFGIFNNESRNLSLGTSGTSRLVIDSSGKVGIGTSAPQDLLHIKNSSAGSNAGLRLENDDQAWALYCRGFDSDKFKIQDIDANTSPFIIETTAPNNTLYLDSSGKVGIGTSSPQTQLQVHNPANAAAYSKFTNVNTGATVTDGTTVGISTAGDFQIWNWESSEVQIATNNVQRMTIDSSGNVEVNNGNLVIGTSGKGIDFSATSGTGTSELLDDYEEGTFTPTLGTTGTGYTSVTYDASVSGSYTKVGRKVFFTLFMGTDAVTKGSASGGITVAGLPFTSNSTLGVGRSVVRLTASNFLADAPIVGTITENTSYIQLSKRATSVSGDTALQVADIGTGANANFMSISGSYQI